MGADPDFQGWRAPGFQGTIGVAGIEQGKLDSVIRSTRRRADLEHLEIAIAAPAAARAGALAGYRHDAVYIRISRYVPPRVEAVRDAMSELFRLLEQEDHPAVRAVLGHWLFGYIHPFSDGNGRMAVFAMNVMLASGGYPWTVIRKEDRDAYLSALDAASIDRNIAPFTAFIAERVRGAMGSVIGFERR